MTSLSDTYDSGPVGAVWTRRQLIAGVAMFALGSILLVMGILAATTNLFYNAFDLILWQVQELAGVMAGVGLPLMIVGLFSVLPSSGRQRIGAAIGLAIALGGVYFFLRVFPEFWYQQTPDYTFHVVAVYFLGLLITFAHLFYAVANFRTRNDPGGAVNLRLDLGSDDGPDPGNQSQESDRNTSVLRRTDSEALEAETQTARNNSNRSD